jgi:hypothetical protein
MTADPFCLQPPTLSSGLSLQSGFLRRIMRRLGTDWAIGLT